MPYLAKPTTATVITLVLLLSACNGNDHDSGGSSPVPVTSTTPSSTTPITSVPAPTYSGADGAAKTSVFNGLNAFRSQATGGGVGQLTQDSQLDTAAQAHADYLLQSSVEDHNEVATNPGYYATTPLARARRAGIANNVWVAELIGDPSQCLQQLLGTVYHLQALTGSAERIGLGYNALVCVLLEATVTGTTSATATAPQANAIPPWGGQQLPATGIAYAPLENSSVPAALSAGEIPRAVPDIANPGYPVMVRVRADASGDVLTVSSFTLSDSSGPVSGRILVASNAKAGSTSSVVVDNLLQAGVAFFIPQNPLVSGYTYTAAFSGARNGTSVGKTWSFKSL